MNDESLDRLRRVTERARAQETTASSTSTPSDDAQPTDAIGAVGRRHHIMRIPVDPAAIADAMIARTRMHRTIDRAQQEPAQRLWEAERRDDETILQAMERAIEEGRERPVFVTSPTSLHETRLRYEGLSADERRDELERHLWATAVPGRTRTCYSDLLDAMGIGR
jgi:hypothetical protein